MLQIEKDTGFKAVIAHKDDIDPDGDDSIGLNTVFNFPFKCENGDYHGFNLYIGDFDGSEGEAVKAEDEDIINSAIDTAFESVDENITDFGIDRTNFRVIIVPEEVCNGY